jgi:NADH:ubiquinone oxidoreductase subunit 2 (subunit N)
MYLSIVILPLLGSIVAGFFGRKIGVKGAQFITSFCVINTTILAIVAFFEVGFNNVPVSIELFRWIDSEWFNISWGFEFDSLTVAMLIPVLIISSLVHIYSISYMSNDPHNQRFFSYLSLFTFMMILLVTGNNYLFMFVGWEGVGVCSYLLVSFWFTRMGANQSSLSAFLTNRVGDCFLTIGMIAILWSLGNLDYATVFSLAPYLNYDVITLIGICLLIGAMAKSSQVGLHVWLPMAMEGPTPVSALIHAATMVTAGVYLLIRSSPLIEYSSTVLLLCLWLGAITTVFSSLVGLFQQDIKKVIAYSTMSQLAREYIKIISIFRHQTICVDVFYFFIKYKANSQITKARDYFKTNVYNHYNFKFFNSSITVRWLFLDILSPQQCSRARIWISYILLYVLNLRDYVKSPEFMLYLEVWTKVEAEFIRWKFEIISKLVGISEAIRLILVFFKWNFIYLKSNLSILKQVFYIQTFKIYFYLLGLLHKESRTVLGMQSSYLLVHNTLTSQKFCKNINKNSCLYFSKKMSTFHAGIYTSVIKNKGALLKNKGYMIKSSDLIFKEWLAGLIDGDGYFLLSKNGFNCCQITMDAKDKKVLSKIQDVYGGRIKPISNAQSLKYKLRNKKGLIRLINDINGLIRNPTRLLQMNKLCIKYEINLKYPDPLTFDNGWFSGFLDSDGSIYYDEDLKDVLISVSQKNNYLLEPLVELYGGRIEINSHKIESFKYVIFRKEQIMNFITNYLHKYPLKTEKMKRVNLIKEFYSLKLSYSNKDIIKLNEWVKFKDRWEKYIK